MKVLIISLYGPPANNVASDRVDGYLKNLPGNGIEVFLLTRYFDASFHGSSDMLIGKQDAGLAGDFMQKGNITYTNFKAGNTKLNTSGKLPPGLRGLYNIYQVDVYHEGWIAYVMNAIDFILKRESINVILFSYGPPVVFKIMRSVKEKYSIPCVLEFRDSYITENDRGALLYLKQKVLARYSRYSNGFVFASEGVKEQFIKNVPAAAGEKMHVLPHGFDESLLMQQENDFSLNDRETINIFREFKNRHKVVGLFSGTLYKGQDMEFFIRSLETLNNQVDGIFGICLLGTYFDSREPVSETSHIIILPKVSKPAALKISLLSDILLMPVWKNRYSGFAGKVSEYCALQRLVAISPDPQNDLQSYVKGNGNVYLFSNNDEFNTFVQKVSSQSLTSTKLDIQKYTKKHLFTGLAGFLQDLEK